MSTNSTFAMLLF